MLRALAAVAIVLATSSAAQAKDYAATARNIIPSGEPGSVPVPAGADEQARMYDALTPLFDQVTDADLQRDFKSEGFGVGPDGPARREHVPFRGVTLVRDRFDVPHITARTRDGVTFAMGWTLAEDRALLLAQGRYAARLAALDINAFGLVVGLEQVSPSAQATRIIRRNGLRALRSHGRAGRRVVHDTGFTDGGFWYLDKDLRTLTGTKFAHPYRTRFCGGGDRARCATAVWAAIEAAGADLARRQGTANPDAWRSNAAQERIRFAPGVLQTTIRYTNRPSGIQQVISFGSHRPR